MKKIIPLLLIITLSNISNAQTILNAGFENWLGTGCNWNGNLPIDWYNFTTSTTSGSPDQSDGLGPCNGSTISQQGNYHMNLEYYSVNSVFEGAKQSISGLTQGLIYKVDFYAVNNIGFPRTDPVTLDVFIDTVVVFSTPILIAGGNWTLYSVNFTATSSTHELGFRVNKGSTVIGNGYAGVDSITLSLLTEIDELPLSTVNIYPNPTNKNISIELGEVKQEIKTTLTNNLGQVIFTQQFESTDFINLEIEAPSGIYFLQICTDDGETKTIKVIKN